MWGMVFIHVSTRGYKSGSILWNTSVCAKVLSLLTEGTWNSKLLYRPIRRNPCPPALTKFLLLKASCTISQYRTFFPIQWETQGHGCCCLFHAEKASNSFSLLAGIDLIFSKIHPSHPSILGAFRLFSNHLLVSVWGRGQEGRYHISPFNWYCKSSGQSYTSSLSVKSVK